MTKQWLALFLIVTIVGLIQGCAWHEYQKRLQKENERKLARMLEQRRQALGLSLRRSEASDDDDVIVGHAATSSGHTHHYSRPAPIETGRTIRRYYPSTQVNGRTYRPTSQVSNCLQYSCPSGYNCKFKDGKFKCIRTITVPLRTPTFPNTYYQQTQTQYRPRYYPSSRYDNSGGCRSGYAKQNMTGAARGYRCVDIDECEDEDDNNCEQVCRNTQGSYVCSCNEGYRKSAYGSCQDIDECAFPRVKLCSHICTNTLGEYNCECPPGFEFKPNSTKICIDIDECKVSDTCPSVDKCLNLYGGHLCIEPEPCPDGYVRAIGNETDDFGPCTTLTPEVSGQPKSISTNYFALYATAKQDSKVGYITYERQSNHDYSFYIGQPGSYYKPFRIYERYPNSGYAEIIARSRLVGPRNYTIDVTMSDRVRYSYEPATISKIIFHIYVSKYERYG